MRRDNNERENNSSELRKLGAQLKSLREAQGLSYDDVASSTHVRPHVIKSMEDGTIEETVAPVYARGFLKTYCEYLMAADLWRKYRLGIPSTDESEEEFTEEAPEQIEISHPTPIFRRSSIIWVYIILIIAVAGAAYLLWSESRQPGRNGLFPLNPPSASEDITPNTAAVSVDETVSAVPLSGDIVSADIPSIPAPLSEDVTVSPDVTAIPPGDISWIDGTSASVRPVIEIPQQPVDRTLLIEITGSNTVLRVERDGKVVTQRTLGIGGRRSYVVSSDTRVRINAGNRARVIWQGQRFDPIGSDNTSIILIFSPNGSVALESGNSPHFMHDAPRGND